MDSVTELKMAVNSTFSSILNEIQISNLNFSIQMTPFAAYITLKKTTQKDQNGENMIPSPPVLFLLQDAYREINDLKAATEMYRSESQKLAQEVATLTEAVHEANEALNDSKTVNSNLLEKLRKAEKEIGSIEEKKTELENKYKVTKHELLDDVNKMNHKIKALEKALKVKEKENFDISRNLNNARDNIKNLKSEKAHIKTCKTKLENDKRKLEKKLKEKEIFQVKPPQTDTSKNYPSSSPSSCISPRITSASLNSFPPTSMVSHFIPLYSMHISGCTASMVTHRGSSWPNKTDEKNLVSKEEFLELWEEFLEQIRVDRKNMLEEMKNEKFWSN